LPPPTPRAGALPGQSRRAMLATSAVMLALAVIAVVAGQLVGGGRGRPVPLFTIDLDVAPERRFEEVIRHFNASIQRVFRVLNHAPVRLALRELSAKRGPEDRELMGEIAGIATATGLPEYGIHFMQMVYELNSVMVPIVNITPPLPFLQGPLGCTGILIRRADGVVYQGRNLDFAHANYLQDLVYTGIFTKGSGEVFRAQMLAAYSMPVTALKRGPNGFSWQVNTRFLDHTGGNLQLLRNLFSERRRLNGWTVRKVLEDARDYEEAVATLSTAKLVSTMYNVIGGVRKGAILARDPDGLARKLTLGDHNFQCREDYIIVTNFDYYFHDVREWFDPTGGGGIGHPRRIAAQRILNASDSLTPQLLFETLSDFHVQARDTIFRAVMSVEDDVWNTSLPDCARCPSPALRPAESVAMPLRSAWPMLPGELFV